MAMRYHWGLGIGHTYTHGRTTPSQPEDPEALPTPNCSTQSNSGSIRAEEDNGDIMGLRGSELKDLEAPPTPSCPTQSNSGFRAEDDDGEDPDADDDDAASNLGSLEERSDRDDDAFLELYDTYHSD